jgi:hypothetical protein
VEWLAHANTCLNVVTVGKPKVLTGLAQNGHGGGRGIVLFPLVNIQSPGEKGEPSPLWQKNETW